MVLDRKTGVSHPLYTDETNILEAVSPGDLAVIYDIPGHGHGQRRDGGRHQRFEY